MKYALDRAENSKNPFLSALTSVPAAEGRGDCSAGLFEPRAEELIEEEARLDARMRDRFRSKGDFKRCLSGWRKFKLKHDASLRKK